MYEHGTVVNNEEGNMNVLTLMVIIILAYWVIAMYSVSRQKDWE